jgi:hypothetical protein|tara:strand:- start:403 stop:765 length:363 start_codon:yes stop_codon:yes gene_type:complete
MAEYFTFSDGDTVTGNNLSRNPRESVNHGTLITANLTAVNGDTLPCNTTGGGFTVTLPSSPSDQDQVTILDTRGQFSTNNLTIGHNGTNLMGLAEDMVISKNNVSLTFKYIATATDWRII